MLQVTSLSFAKELQMALVIFLNKITVLQLSVAVETTLIGSNHALSPNF